MASVSRVVIGPPEARVTIEVVGRMHPEHTDFWDGNWLVSPVTIHVGGFRGTLQAGLRAEELRDFRVELEAVWDRMDGSAHLASMEGWLDLSVKMGTRGQLEVLGTAHDEPGYGSQLEFKLNGLDQSFIPDVVESLRQVEAAFPVLGRR